MNTPEKIIDYLGKEAVADALGIRPDAIRIRLRDGKLPASWYATLETMCGRPLDRKLFSFKGKTK